MIRDLIDFNFPPSFIEFLKKAGSLALPYWETYWVNGKEKEDIVSANNFEHTEVESALPDYLITFQNDGMGNHPRVTKLPKYLSSHYLFF